MANKEPDSNNLLSGHRPGRGRPQGSRNKRNVAYDVMAERDAESIIGNVVGKALDGDMNAAKIILDRIWRVPRDRLIKINLPPINSIADVPPFIAGVVQAVANAEITPAEGASLGALIDRFQSALALVDLEQRIQQLETGAPSPRLAVVK